MKNRWVLFTCLLMALMALGVTAFAGTLPSTTGLQFQTSARERPPTIGDWYTTRTSSSTDRVHRILVEVTQALLNANGGTVNVQIFDAESNGNLDEVFNTPDPTRFELRASNGTTVLQSQNVASGAANGTTVTFTINAVGTYQVVAMTGAFPINGDATTGLNDDDNTYSVSIPGADTIIGQFQGTFSPTQAVNNLQFYFLCGPGTPDLRLRNFDMDGTTGNPQITYTRPSGATVSGTTSGNGVWNNNGSLNSGEDTVTIGQAKPFPDAGQWGLGISSVGSGNQFILEANAGTNRLVILDTPPSNLVVGNFLITPDGTLPGAVGSNTDHPFTITNYFYTTDIINLSLSGTAANYNVQLYDASTNTPLTDTDGDGNVDSGIMQPNSTKNFYLRVIPQVGAGASDTTKISATSFMNVRVAPTKVVTEFVNKTTQLTNVTNISGTVYSDANHNGSLDAGESGLATTNFFVKLVPSAGGNAIAASAVNPTTGTYQFNSISSGTYNLVLDDNSTLTDTTPTQPPNTTGTEAATGIRAVTVPVQGAINQNFGRYSGAILSGKVFKDNGSPSGTPNDGAYTTENGIGGVSVKITNSAGTVTFDSTTTDASGNYSLYVPPIGTPVKVVENNLSGYRSTGGQAGNTGGTYSLATDATTFTVAAGTSYANVNFGDVPYSVFTDDNLRVVAPGETALMPHTFTAGTAGSLSFTVSDSANPSTTGWTSVLYRDINGDGVLQSGDTIITAPITVTAGQSVSVLVKTYSPANAPFNAKDTISIVGALTYTNQTSIVETISHTDTVTVSRNDGLKLTKAVDRSTAKSGDDITYTITYQNTGNGPITNLVISDYTPAYCTFRSAANGTLPAALTGVTTSTPTTTGPIKWTFSGVLNPNESGTVTFVVRLQ